MMLDWLIIGGGVHGTALSFYLTHRCGVAHDRLRVLDPYEMPLDRWRARAANVGMTYLRSPGVHHLHYDPWSLRTFAETLRGQPYRRFIPMYNRPSLELFDHYSAWLVERYQLDHLRCCGSAQGLTRISGGWRVETGAGGLEARRVILALGSSAPYWPPWAIELRRSWPGIRHVFDNDFVRAPLPAGSQAVIIGGGISAAQTALAVACEQPGTVTLLMRHAPRVSHFDSDPCWVTSICLDQFHREPDYGRRRAMIQQARQPGSLPPDVLNELKMAVNTGSLALERGEVQDALIAPQGKVVLHTPERLFTADHILLATGFENARPGGVWLQMAVEMVGLPCTADGMPFVDRTLCWSNGLYVSGALAELEIGPTARNIIGARLAAERIGLAAHG